jgi:quinol monooxygenase YgiN
MTTIAENTTLATLINVFTVKPDNAAALATLLHEATETVMRHVDGFVSANIHISDDRTRVVNYAQWRSEADYRAMFSDPVAREHMSGAAALAEGFDPHLYTVETVCAAP